MSSLPRHRAAAEQGIRDGRRPLSDAPQAASEPTVASPPAAVRPERSTRPQGTSRIALDTDETVAQRFRDRAHQRRWSQREALTGALTLLDELDDGAYDALLCRVTGR